MLLWFLRKLFGALIGKLPEEKRKQLWAGFESLLSEAVEAAARGATDDEVKGIAMKFKKEFD